MSFHKTKIAALYDEASGEEDGLPKEGNSGENFSENFGDEMSSDDEMILIKNKPKFKKKIKRKFTKVKVKPLASMDLSDSEDDKLETIDLKQTKNDKERLEQDNLDNNQRNSNEFQRNVEKYSQRNTQEETKKVRFQQIRKKTEEPMKADDGSDDENLYSSENLKKMLKFQSKKAKEKTIKQNVPSTDNKNEEFPDRNFMNLTDEKQTNNSTIKIYDDKTIEKIKSQKLYLRSKLSEKEEKDMVIKASTIDKNVIELDDDIMNSSDSDDSSAISNNNLASNKIIEKNSLINNITSNGSTTHNLFDNDNDEETLGISEFRDSRLLFNPDANVKLYESEIKNALYEYDLDGQSEDGELTKWENQKILNAISLNNNSMRASDDHIVQELVNAVNPKNKYEQSFRKFPKVNAIFENYSMELQKDGFGPLDSCIEKLKTLKDTMTDFKEEKLDKLQELNYDYEDLKDQKENIQETINELADNLKDLH